MQATLFEGYMVGLVVLVCGLVGAYKLEQLDLSNTNPVPPGQDMHPGPIYRRLESWKVGRSKG